MSARRPPPAPTTGRKPQTGLPPGKERRRGPTLGPHLNYLVWLHGQGSALAKLAKQELMLWRKTLSSEEGDRLPANAVPRPLTGILRLRPGDDPLLRLDPDAITRLDPSRSSSFDPTRPAVTVCLEFLGALRDLPPLGVIPAVQAGDLFAGWVNLDRVAELAGHPAVVRIEALRTWGPTGDPEGERGGSPNGWSSASARATGQGVRIAVIDLGFDFLHPAFLRQVGGAEKVRTLWLHDMELSPPSPTGSLGLRLTRAELQDALDWYSRPLIPSCSRPVAVETHLARLETVPDANPEYRTLVQQHGTAVTGIAAGNGRDYTAGSTLQVPGVAPDADLVLIAIGAHDETRFADFDPRLSGIPRCV